MHEKGVMSNLSSISLTIERSHVSFMMYEGVMSWRTYEGVMSHSHGAHMKESCRTVMAHI